MAVKRYGIAAGSIPEKITAVLRTKVGYKTPGGDFKAKAAFVTGADSKSSIETSKRWAESYGPGKTSKPEVVTQDNKVIPHLRAVDLDERGEGGRAWKVLTPEGWYVDLREDVILDVFKAGCKMSKHPDGGLLLEGPFQWVKYGTQTRIVLVNSDIYREISESNDLKKLAKIRSTDLVVGGVYVSSSRKVGVYIGKVLFKGKKCFAWVSLCFYGDKDPLKASQAEIVAEFKQAQGYAWCYQVAQSFNFTSKIGDIAVPPNPEKWFDYREQYDWVEDVAATAEAYRKNRSLPHWQQIEVPVKIQKVTRPLTWL